MALFTVRAELLKKVIAILHFVAWVMAEYWALTMGILWYVSEFLPELGLAMLVSAQLMVIPFLSLGTKPSKRLAAVFILFNILWILSSSSILPFYVLGFLSPYYRSRAFPTVITGFAIDILGGIIIALSALFFEKDYVIYDQEEEVPS